VLGRGGRWVNNDVASIQEKLLLDIAAGVKLLRERGCEQVVLLGSARGGPLAALYQREARKSPPHRLTDTAAGDSFDLNQYDLPPADAIALIGPHMGGAYSLLKWIDPSVTDESDALAGNTSLDMYDPANGFRIPPQPSHYATEFVTRYRAAQAARVQRLDRIARSRIARRREAGRQAKELAAAGRNGAELRRLQRIASMPDHLRIYRMVCSFENDPRPDLMNDGPGYAHFLKPEAFLSTWSELSTRTRTAECLREVPDPLLVVHYAGDSGTRISEARQMFDASPAADKAFVLVRNADHYGFRILGLHQRGDRVAEGTDAVVAWMKVRFPCRFT
jgi:pimeloyl-ACP methyl ester carboxylesterase